VDDGQRRETICLDADSGSSSIDLRDNPALALLCRREADANLSRYRLTSLERTGKDQNSNGGSGDSHIVSIAFREPS
jgi:hypothetical protein